jgi:hypothetical protein
MTRTVAEIAAGLPPEAQEALRQAVSGRFPMIVASAASELVDYGCMDFGFALTDLGLGVRLYLLANPDGWEAAGRVLGFRGNTAGLLAALMSEASASPFVSASGRDAMRSITAADIAAETALMCGGLTAEDGLRKWLADPEVKAILSRDLSSNAEGGE